MAQRNSLFRSPAFRVALFGGLSAGPVLALLWPMFVRLESGVWPASMVALTVAMLTLGTVVGVAVALTVFWPVLAMLKVEGRGLRWIAAGVGGVVCLLLVVVFGLFAPGDRLGAQWPLGLFLTITGALSGWLGALTVRPGDHPPS